MLFALAAFYFFHKVKSLPVPYIDQRAPSTQACDDLAHCRTIWNIIWSCLVTIFACTYAAIHPNVPMSDPNRHWYSGLLRRARIMICALIGPEFVIIWALRQWFAARRKLRNLKGVCMLG